MLRNLVLVLSPREYRYLVKYNYVGGRIYANDTLVGTVTDVDTPVVFYHPDPQVTISVSGVPRTEQIIREVITPEADIIWDSNASYISGNIRFMGSAQSGSRYVTIRYTLSSSSLRVDRYADIYDYCRYTEVTHDLPPNRSIAPDKVVSLYYIDIFTDREGLLRNRSEHREYTLVDSDPISINLSIDITEYPNSGSSMSNTLTSSYTSTIGDIRQYCNINGHYYSDATQVNGSIRSVSGTAKLLGRTVQI